jgi:MFS family permease
MALSWIAERVGYRWTVSVGALVIGSGLAFSAIGGSWQLIVGHALFIGVLGSGAINVPLFVYVSRWFDRRRGSALALVASGQYIAGAIWPSAIALGIEHAGWRVTMTGLGIVTAVAIVPVALLCLSPAPEPKAEPLDATPGRRNAPVLGFSPAVAFALLSLAGVLCCIPMAMPAAHLVALCSDLGIGATRGALMLSVLLGSAFLSRQLWGWLSDRVGGLYTILAASACQAAALAGFVWIRGEAGLFVVSAAFGLGFSGIIPAYVLALRELFPADEASWRVPVWFFINLGGMALGGWLAGYMFDHLAVYGPAFLVGVTFNVANIVLIGWMATRQRRRVRPVPPGSLIRSPTRP